MPPSQQASLSGSATALTFHFFSALIERLLTGPWKKP